MSYDEYIEQVEPSAEPHKTIDDFLISKIQFTMQQIYNHHRYSAVCVHVVKYKWVMHLRLEQNHFY